MLLSLSSSVKKTFVFSRNSREREREMGKWHFECLFCLKQKKTRVFLFEIKKKKKKKTKRSISKAENWENVQSQTIILMIINVELTKRSVYSIRKKIMMIKIDRIYVKVSKIFFSSSSNSSFGIFRTNGKSIAY
jgi:hypothetical protein